MSQSAPAETHQSNNAAEQNTHMSSQQSSSQIHSNDNNNNNETVHTHSQQAQSHEQHSQNHEHQHTHAENKNSTPSASRRRSHSPASRQSQHQQQQHGDNRVAESAQESATPSRFNFADGRGVKLGELPCFSQAPKRGKGAAALEMALEPLHSLIYNRRGKTGERRAALHDFAGFPASMTDEVKEKLNRLDKKKLQTLIKSIGINVKSSAKRAELVDGLAQFVMSPNAENLIAHGSKNANKQMKRTRSSATSQRTRSTSPSKRARKSSTTHVRKTARTSSTRHGKRNRTSSRSPSHTSSTSPSHRGRKSSPLSRSRSTSPHARKGEGKRRSGSHGGVTDEAIKSAIYEHVLLLPCDERKQLGAKSLRLHLEQHFHLPDSSLKTRKELIATTASNCVKALVEAEQAAIAAAATGDINKVLLHTPFEPEGDSQSGINASPTPLAEQVVDELKEKAAFFTEEEAVMQVEKQVHDVVQQRQGRSSSAHRAGSVKTSNSESLKTTPKKLPGESNLSRDAINLPTSMHDAHVAQFQAAKDELHSTPNGNEHAKADTPERGPSVHETSTIHNNLLEKNNKITNVESENNINLHNYQDEKSKRVNENTNDGDNNDNSKGNNNIANHSVSSINVEADMHNENSVDSTNKASDTTTVAQSANMINTLTDNNTIIDTASTSEKKGEI